MTARCSACRAELPDPGTYELIVTLGPDSPRHTSVCFKACSLLCTARSLAGMAAGKHERERAPSTADLMRERPAGRRT